jgi:hypothetical protein
MKVALCFIISYEHILNKEDIWREWIEPNKDIINVYFYYKDLKKIKSQWIAEHTIPPNFIYETSYYHVVPAYLSIMKFAIQHDTYNSWFCMLTDSCCPIISPKKFRHLFYNYYDKSIMSWKEAWWNKDFHKRANLSKLPKELHLANDPWFTLKRENVVQVLNFINKQQEVTKLICSGGLANESLFAIILYGYKQLKNNNNKSPVISAVTHITDWSRMASATSPHLFKDANEKDIQFIDSELAKNKYAMFIRKISPEFPNEILRHYIYEQNKDSEEKLLVIQPVFFIYNRYKNYLYFVSPYFIFLAFIFFYFYKK